MTGTPRAANMSATVVLPLPIPPVKPMLNMVNSFLSTEQRIQRRTKEQCDRAAGRKKRSERQWFFEAHLADTRCREAKDRACHCRQQHDLRQRLPAEPRPKCCEKLEVAIAHAFDAAHQPEQP